MVSKGNSLNFRIILKVLDDQKRGGAYRLVLIEPSRLIIKSPMFFRSFQKTLAL
jgi:hypothetical protein